MSIKNIKERLEGSYRLIRIKRIKTGFYLVQLVLALVLGSVISAMLNASFDPLFLPMDTFLFIILLILLIITVEAIYFKGLEVKYTRNKSRKFLLARNAIRRSLVIIAVSGIMILVLIMPYTQEELAKSHAPAGSDIIVEFGQTSGNTSFKTQDRLGLVRVSEITIEVNNSQCTLDLWLDGLGGVNIWNPNPTGIYEFSGLYDRASKQADIYIIVENNVAPSVNFSYSVTSKVSPFISFYFPVMGMIFIIVQSAAISILYPIRETYASSSIYSKKYVPPKDAGEYKPTEPLSTRQKEEQALFDKVIDIELPPPIPAAPQAKVACEVQTQPKETVEMARVKGKVDDGIIDEPDIKCPTCREMNSAQSAICFSCGNALEAMAEVTKVDPMVYLRKGDDFASAGKYEDALSCYDEVLKNDGANVKALLRKGSMLHALGKWGTAIQYVNTALQLNPDDVEALLLKARILDERDRMDKSLEIYSQILAIDPDNEMAKTKMESVSQKFVEAAAEAELESAEDVLEQFMCVPGIGLARATALYDSGITSMQMLKDASEDRLASIKGISKGLAKKIRKGLDSL